MIIGTLALGRFCIGSLLYLATSPFSLMCLNWEVKVRIYHNRHHLQTFVERLSFESGISKFTCKISFLYNLFGFSLISSSLWAEYQELMPFVHVAAKCLKNSRLMTSLLQDHFILLC